MSYPLGFRQETCPTFLNPEGLPLDPTPFKTRFGLELPSIVTASNELSALYRFVKEKREHEGPLPSTNQLERIVLNPESGCWELPSNRATATLDTKSSTEANLKSEWYGRMAIKGVKGSLAHRAMFTVMRGEIKDGLVLDHLCLNKKCCYHRHLEPITQADNIRRVLDAKRLEEGQGLLFYTD